MEHRWRMNARQLLYSVSVPISLGDSRDCDSGRGIINSDAVTCRQLRHLGNFRVTSAAPASGAPPLALGLPPLAVAYRRDPGMQGTDPYTQDGLFFCLSLWCFGPLSDGRHLSREGGMSGTRGIRGPGPILNIRRSHAIGVMPSVFRASPGDRWPDRVMGLYSAIWPLCKAR